MKKSAENPRGCRFMYDKGTQKKFMQMCVLYQERIYKKPTLATVNVLGVVNTQRVPDSVLTTANTQTDFESTRRAIIQEDA